jgi:prepilin-type processing-associated H-X9-DG protein
MGVYFCPSLQIDTVDNYIGPSGYKWFSERGVQRNCPPPTCSIDPFLFSDRGYIYIGYLMANDAEFMSVIHAVDIACGQNAVKPSYNEAAEILDGNINLPAEADVRAWAMDRSIAYMADPYVDGVGVWDASLWAYSGSGGGDTCLKLREGVERFMITDINNPGASASAQSETAVMWDQQQGIQTNGDVKFSHVPGGANVLYMDGHVEFIKYPSQEMPMTRLMGAAGTNW